jgi:hypothetical protein
LRETKPHAVHVSQQAIHETVGNQVSTSVSMSVITSVSTPVSTSVSSPISNKPQFQQLRADLVSLLTA